MWPRSAPSRARCWSCSRLSTTSAMLSYRRPSRSPDSADASSDELEDARDDRRDRRRRRAALAGRRRRRLRRSPRRAPATRPLRPLLVRRALRLAAFEREVQARCACVTWVSSWASSALPSAVLRIGARTFAHQDHAGVGDGDGVGAVRLGDRLGERAAEHAHVAEAARRGRCSISELRAEVQLFAARRRRRPRPWTAGRLPAAARSPGSGRARLRRSSSSRAAASSGLSSSVAMGAPVQSTPIMVIGKCAGKLRFEREKARNFRGITR